MSGRPLDAVRIVPPNLWQHLSAELGIDAPDLASLRALYHRDRTLYDHQQLACEWLRFQHMSEHQRQRARARLARRMGPPCRSRSSHGVRPALAV
jgi:hypothetical protein